MLTKTQMLKFVIFFNKFTEFQKDNLSLKPKSLLVYYIFYFNQKKFDIFPFFCLLFVILKKVTYLLLFKFNK